MRFGTLARSALIFVPLLLVCVGRLHAQRAAAPDRLTQEVNRCLTVIRVAAARRRSTGESPLRDRTVRTDGTAAWTPQHSPRSARA
jgi:hypothetical protein